MVEVKNYLIRYIIQKDLFICNIGDSPTFQVRNRSEVLDITIANEFLERKISQWEVSPLESFSDHKYIFFKLGLQIRATAEQFRNPRKTDWDKYQNILKNSTVSISSSSDFNGKVESFYEDITSAYITSTPVSRNYGNKKRNDWWNRDLAEQRKQISKLRKRIDLFPNNTELVGERTILLTRYKNNIRKAKRASWWRFTEEIRDCNYLAKIKKIMKKLGSTKHVP